MRWRFVRSLSAAALLAAVLVLASGCFDAERTGGGAGSRRTDSGNTILVAAMGNWEEGSRLAWEGLELAANEINRSGGILGKQLTLWRHNVSDDPRQGVRQAQAIADNPASAMAVLFSRQRVAVPASTVLAYYGVMTMLTQVSAPLNEINLPLLFRMCPTDSDELDFLTTFCVRKKIQRVALFVFNGESARLYANTFETDAKLKGMSVTSRTACDMLTTEATMKRELTNLGKHAPYDAIFYSGPVLPAVRLLRAAADLGIQQPFLGGSRWDTPELAKATSSNSTSVYLATPFAPDVSNQPARRFIDAYRQAYGEDPSAEAAITYNALHIYAEAVRLAGATAPDKVSAALIRKTVWNGPFGLVKFNAVGELVSSHLYIKHFSGGKFQILDPGGEVNGK